ncbi:unnamed protein product [Miscanthus lutarioriparius]|uniref:Uncharacterized protein n=1 Tax=Miscanthus lutarioriparius TaxID=422564 RepID=A0A811MVJ2_9POAL|nr:unnamed protein product [Miscanthus lutarioriparius]CAD6216676.1 unnamed protein product [Miscanthus lutarioriparius]
MALPASSSGLFRFVSPRSRPQSTDIVAAASWGVFAGTAALYLVQIGSVMLVWCDRRGSSGSADVRSVLGIRTPVRSIGV